MKLRPAQVLVELMVAFAVAVVAIVALVQSSTKSLSNATVSKYETQATQYANEAIDWLRGQKNKSWPSFKASATGDRCLSSLPTELSSVPSGSCGNTVIQSTPSTAFVRYVHFENSNDVVIATVYVLRDTKEISRQIIEFRNY